MGNQWIAEAVTQALIDDGLMIEAGWMGFKMLAAPKNAPDDQVAAMRFAFFAGAHHAFASAVTSMESGHEATKTDMRRVEQIADELDAWVKENFPDAPT